MFTTLSKIWLIPKWLLGDNMEELIEYLKSKKYKIKWIIGDTVYYLYLNAKGNHVRGKIISKYEYRRLKKDGDILWHYQQHIKQDIE